MNTIKLTLQQGEDDVVVKMCEKKKNVVMMFYRFTSLRFSIRIRSLMNLCHY